MICPRCRSADCLRSHRTGLQDFLSTAGGLRPWRCRSCELRFYAWRVAARFSRYAHCPKCGNFELSRIAPEHAGTGILVSVKRLLRFPAYRCVPCREKILTIRPFHRIVPSVVSAAERKVSAPLNPPD